MQLCNHEVGLSSPVFLIAGPCAIESEKMALETAAALKKMTSELGILFIYKSSFDKANRSSSKSFRGPGIEEGLRILAKVRDEIGVPVLTDVHEDTPMDEVADVVDVLQTPAFLCRQTNFIQKVAKTGKPVNIKKGQFLAPGDMVHVVEKARAGVSGLFMETHPDPDKALSDGPNAWPLDKLQPLLETLIRLDGTVKAGELAETAYLSR